MDCPNRYEEERLLVLRSLNVLHTPREKRFDDVTHLASQLLRAPIALVSLVVDNYQWFKSCVGLDADSTSRDVSFCTYAIAQDDLDQVFVVPDATKDERFKNNALVTGAPGIRMYAGAPLVTRDGFALGALCVIDTTPRHPSAAELESLRVLARSVVSQMELTKTAEGLRASEEENRLIIESASDAIVTVDAAGTVRAWNARAVSLFGYTVDSAVGRPVTDLIRPLPGQDGADIAAVLAADQEAADIERCETTACGCDGRPLHVDFSCTTLSTASGRVRTAFIHDISDRKLHETQVRETATREVAIFALAKLAESRDSDTGAHIERVRSYCRALAERLRAMGHFADELSDEFIHTIFITSPLHDIGKVGIPDGVLLKPGRLSDREFEIMKTHTTLGAETLEAAMRAFPQTAFFRMARDIAATHHERYDGTGYPLGLRGNDIPLAGRIVAVADVYDALTSRRVYKEAFPHEIAKGIMLKDAGTHFDPSVIAAFEAAEEEFLFIRASYELSVPAMAA